MKSRRLSDALKAASEANQELSEAIDEALKSRDPFAAFIAESRRSFRYAVDHSRKSGKDIERAVLGTWQLAQMRGYKGDYREWEKVLRTDSVGAWQASGDLPQ